MCVCLHKAFALFKPMGKEKIETGEEKLHSSLKSVKPLQTKVSMTENEGMEINLE